MPHQHDQCLGDTSQAIDFLQLNPNERSSEQLWFSEADLQ